MNRLPLRIVLYALLLAFFPAALTAQTTSQNAARPTVRQVTPRPLSARPTGLTSVSTAESGALHDHPPLSRLPSFQVTKLDGTASDISSSAQSRHWLLLYRRENCVPCDRMLKTLAESDNALLRSGTQLVIVVADSGKTNNANRLDATRAKFSAITGATWLEDPNDAVLKALKPHGAPMLYALSGSRIQWSQPGLPPDPATLSKMAASWVNSTDPLPPTPASTAPPPAPTSAPVDTTTTTARPKP